MHRQPRTSHTSTTSLPLVTQ
ncbi:hypothetical protein C368_02770 [Cryptococcus neoformans 125.91]|nr:hypothetical protein C368_02770 [Cryptococcus neoformans var. grubii 125.91]